MSKKRDSIAERLLSTFLAFIMVVGLIPTTVFASAAGYEGFYTITVQGADGNGIEGATVDYDLSVGGETISAEPTTDSNGVVVVDLSAYADVITETTPATMMYTISKEGYENTSTSEPVEIKAIDGDVVVTLESAEPEISRYTVSVSKIGEGSVRLNGEEYSSVTGIENSTVSLEITSDENHRIAAIIIDGEMIEFADDISYSDTITLTKNMEIAVTFVKVFTVTVNYDNENGAVVTNPETINGTVTVTEGTYIGIIATPNENYRVSEVLINDQPQEGPGANDYIYNNANNPLVADKNYNVEVTFAPNRYNVSVEIPEGQDKCADITINSVIGTTAEITHNGEAVISIAPKEGYALDSFKVNGTELTREDTAITINEEGVIEYKISSVVEDKTIEISFSETEKAKDYSVSTPIRNDGLTYIYSSSQDITISTEKDGIKVYYENGMPEGGKNTKAVTVDGTKNIVGIKLFYSEGKSWPSWHTAEGISKTTPLRVVVDEKSPNVNIVPESANVNGYYNSDVKIEITPFEEEADYSGIASVDYWITDDENSENKTVEETNIFNENENGEYDKKPILITVDSSRNNTDTVTVHVKVTDKAGNTRTKIVELKINSTTPDIKIDIDGKLHEEALETFYNTVRTATIKFTDRDTTFDQTSAINSIVIEKLSEGNYVPVDEMTKSDMIQWSAESDPESSVATVTFDADGTYKWSVNTAEGHSYVNLAGTEAAEPTVTGESIYEFTIDKAAPNASIKFDEETTWSSIIETLLFGIWKNEAITITAKADDVTSGVQSVLYYITNETTVLSKEQIEALYANEETRKNFVKEPIVVDADEQFLVYVRVTDKAGNPTYISTNGLIVDMTKPVIDIAINEGTKPNANGIHNADVLLDVEITEVIENDTYSGLKEIYYSITDEDSTVEDQLFVLDSEINKGEVLYDDDETKYAVMTWSGSIPVNATEFNSNNVVVKVWAVDRAGNGAEEVNVEAIELKIDSKAPVVKIDYDTNNARNGKYYNTNRTAAITVTERNFDKNAVAYNITNTDGVIPTLDVNAWKKVEGTGGVNGDETQWINYVVFSADGDYTFELECTDLADNKSNKVVSEEFTIDKTNPTISVSYDNNSAQNGKYFKAARIATVTIREHNFDANAVRFTQTASLNGSGINIPSASWSHSGDVHTATFSYSADGDYTFDVTMSDMAGNESGAANYGSSVAAKDFTVDKTITKPVIGGVENGHAYKGDVIPTITFNDVNYASYEVKLLRTRMGEKNVDVTSKYIKSVNVGSQGGSGTYDTFDKIADNDGIYNLTVTMTDKAGNQESENITFTVNRFGSVYEYSDYLISLLTDGGAYVESVTKDLVITEYNADRLVGNSLNIEITCDGKPLDNVIYDVSPAINDQTSVGSSGWFEYQYTISKANFAADGVYKISISSKDATGNTPENSNYDDKNILFRVDSTKPEITSIVGLEKNIINAQEVVVTYTVFDAIGLKSIRILVNGQQAGDTITDFGDDLNNYTGTFVLSENSSVQDVQILVEDLSGNITDTDAEDFSSAYVFNDSVTVSTNMFVRWYANKALFWGSIGAVVVLVGGLWFFLVAKRKKKEEK